MSIQVVRVPTLIKDQIMDFIGEQYTMDVITADQYNRLDQYVYNPDHMYDNIQDWLWRNIDVSNIFDPEFPAKAGQQMIQKIIFDDFIVDDESSS